VRRTGLVAALVLLAALVGSFLRIWFEGSARRGAAPVASVLPGDFPRPAPAQLAAVAVAELARATRGLSEAEARARERASPAPPPSPSSFASPTACVRTYLPGVDVAAGSLDLLCDEADAWKLERRLYERIAHRPGDVARWTRLGHYSLAAVATLRSGCCVSAPPLRAVVPGLWCGVLGDQLRALGPVPVAEAIGTFDETMRCLLRRGMRLPERWDHISVQSSRAAFDELWGVARERGRR
jgi:hypothetical protein